LIRLGWAQLVAVRGVRRTCAALIAVGERPVDDFSSAIDALREAYVALVTGMFPLSSAIGPPLALLRRAGTLHAHASRHRTITAELATAVEDVRSGRMSLEEFLERFGHRGVYESDIARPRYRDDPSVLNVSTLASEPMAAKRPDIETSTARRSWRVTATVPLWWLARQPLAARETLRHEAMRAFAALRSSLVDLAQRAVERGRLPDVDTLWTLTTDEARSIDHGAVFTVTDKNERLARREALAKLQPPPVVRRFDDPVSWGDRDASAEGQVVWRGLSLTSGTVRGRAWVLDEPAHVLPAGWDGSSTVLVARSIDAGWVTTLTLVAGAVIETGGDLSHGSILVRELGLPAVTNLRGVRSGVRSGDVVELRAHAGVVELLEQSPKG
jgi:pyruvate,water dikinase